MDAENSARAEYAVLAVLTVASRGATRRWRRILMVKQRGLVRLAVRLGLGGALEFYDFVVISAQCEPEFPASAGKVETMLGPHEPNVVRSQTDKEVYVGNLELSVTASK